MDYSNAIFAIGNGTIFLHCRGETKISWMRQTILQIHPKDNVLVALANLKMGESVSYEEVSYVLASDIPAKHKFFMQDMKTGEDVIMYGTLVGKVQKDVKSGQLMTTENTI